MWLLIHAGNKVNPSIVLVKGTHLFSLAVFMMTSSNGNIFRVTGHLCGEFTGPGEFPAQRPVTRSFDVFFDRRLNKQLSKQSWGWWFETHRAHYDVIVMKIMTTFQSWCCHEMETISFYTMSMVDVPCKGLVMRSLDVFLLLAGTNSRVDCDLNHVTRSCDVPVLSTNWHSCMCFICTVLHRTNTGFWLPVFGGFSS